MFLIISNTMYSISLVLNLMLIFQLTLSNKVLLSLISVKIVILFSDCLFAMFMNNFKIFFQWLLIIKNFNSKLLFTII